MLSSTINTSMGRSALLVRAACDIGNGFGTTYRSRLLEARPAGIAGSARKPGATISSMFREHFFEGPAIRQVRDDRVSTRAGEHFDGVLSGRNCERPATVATRAFHVA